MKKNIARIISVMSALIMTFTFLAVSPAKLSGNAVGEAEREYADIAEEMAMRFNEARAELGLQPLYYVPCLADVAEVRANDIITLYDHYRPDGTKVGDLVAEYLDEFKVAEVLARGSDNVDAVFNAWKNSPMHWGYITKPEASHMGISLVYDAEAERKWYWAAVIITLTDGETQYLPDQRLPMEKAIVPKHCGDVNGDGQIDSFDLVLLTRYINDKVYFNEAQVAAADVFADGAITTADAAALRKYILGGYSCLPITIDMIMK